jgi:hypothetical protein
LGEKKEEIERNKTPQKPGGIGLGLGRNRSGKRRLGFGSAARRPEVGDGPDRWAPPVSAWREGRGRGWRRLGPAWAARGGERGRERSWAEIGPTALEGDFLNFLN